MSKEEKIIRRSSRQSDRDPAVEGSLPGNSRCPRTISSVELCGTAFLVRCRRKEGKGVGRVERSRDALGKTRSSRAAGYFTYESRTAANGKTYENPSDFVATTSMFDAGFDALMQAIHVPRRNAPLRKTPRSSENPGSPTSRAHDRMKRCKIVKLPRRGSSPTLQAPAPRSWFVNFPRRDYSATRKRRKIAAPGLSCCEIGEKHLSSAPPQTGKYGWAVHGFHPPVGLDEARPKARLHSDKTG
ncbi:hypothetical protein KM043_012398 [Ampulex compressa]|nr:hypothetical protein KM043_012398 [Ampulex compressa]